MIYYFSPYSIEKNLFDAYDKHAQLVPDENDWICFTDGDVLFLTPNYGHILEGYIKRYPEMGMFVAYASRAGYPSAMSKLGNAANPDITFHRDVAVQLLRKFGPTLAIKPYNRRASGHLMLIKKSTWSKIRDEAKKLVEDEKKKILGVDTKISYAILGQGMKIGLMRAIYVLHYFRLKEKGSKKHLV